MRATSEAVHSTSASPEPEGSTGLPRDRAVPDPGTTVALQTERDKWLRLNARHDPRIVSHRRATRGAAMRLRQAGRPEARARRDHRVAPATPDASGACSPGSTRHRIGLSRGRCLWRGSASPDSPHRRGRRGSRSRSLCSRDPPARSAPPGTTGPVVPSLPDCRRWRCRLQRRRVISIVMGASLALGS